MKSTLVSVDNLKIAFRKNGVDTIAVRKLTFSIKEGETLAIVGESGSGKSVSALACLGLLSDNAVISGSINWHCQDHLNYDQKNISNIRGREAGIIFQEPMTSLNPLHTIEKQIGEALRLHQKLDGLHLRKRVLKLLDRVGISNAEQRLSSFPHELSGGQRQRVMIAMALANGPKLLIADEPTTALDVTIEAQIIDLLLDLQQETGMAMLFISHDLGLVRQIANRVIVLKNGQVIEEGLKQQIFDFPTSEYTRSLVNSKVNMERNWKKKSTAVILETKNINVKFPIRTGLLRRTSDFVHAVVDTSFKLYSGESLGIVGESGSGKSTLARALTKLIPHEGSVYYAGYKVEHKSSSLLKPYRQKVQIVFQDPYGSLSPRLSIREIIAEGPKAHGHKNNLALQKQIDEVLEEVGLEPETQLRYPHEFSGGQRQRVAIARALILKPEIIIFDEPTSALDPEMIKEVLDSMVDLAKGGMTMIVVTHEMGFAKEVADNMIFMDEGKIVEKAKTKEFFDNPKSDRTKLFLSQIL